MINPGPAFNAKLITSSVTLTFPPPEYVADISQLLIAILRPASKKSKIVASTPIFSPLIIIPYPGT
jgi:hypothetical protein